MPTRNIPITYPDAAETKLMARFIRARPAIPEVEILQDGEPTGTFVPEFTKWQWVKMEVAAWIKRECKQGKVLLDADATDDIDIS